MPQEPPRETNQPEPEDNPSEPNQTRSIPPHRRAPVRRRANRESAASSVPGSRQPFLIAQTVQVLRSTIRSLEAVVSRLETDPELVSTPSQGIGAQILAVIRAFLPRALSRRVSDAVLTGAIASLAALILIAIVGLNWLPGQPTPTEVATLPSPEVTPIPAIPPATEPPPTPEPVIEPSPIVEASPLAAPEPSPVVPEPESRPPETDTPETAAPIAETPAPAIEPEPPPPLTPEQQLVALIQTEVTKLSDPYQSGLVQAVQPNYRSSRLVIQLSQQWNDLNPTQQHELANQLLRQAQELNFSKLEVTDLAGKILARSPVVGTDMVIIRRSLDPQTTA
ncbi:hypothetical protein [Pantanalinema sp. GBBB05]|uniref:hypothetical protein n=1 Tax=Pantanalinema sp. GBBB05 TaxID=2604139 RepID=UPI001D86E2DA|nr:hypothetical protein [Pantanalinema sp. GBBB05]